MAVNSNYIAQMQYVPKVADALALLITLENNFPRITKLTPNDIGGDLVDTGGDGLFVQSYITSVVLVHQTLGVS